MAKQRKKIVRLSAHDVLRLSAVEITPTGNVVTIGGRNASGKSSILNCIQMALGGKRVTPQKPIREGAEEASIVLDLGDIIVERIITADGGDRLTVRSPEGARYPRPQEMLNKLFSTISFDPLKFLSEPDDKQVEIMRRLTGLDFTVLDERSALLFNERTETNREGKALKARVEATPVHEGVTEVSVAELADELERRTQQVQKNARTRATVGECEQAIAHKLGRIDDIDAGIEKLEKQIATEREKRAKVQVALEQDLATLESIRAAVADLVEPDIDQVRMQLKSAEETNAKVRANAERAKLTKELDGLRERSEDLTKKLDAIDASKAEQLAKAAFPVPGLSFSATAVLFNGLPFSQASRAEQLRVSMAIGIAMNPELSVLLIRDGSVVDSDGLALIASMADEHDFQVWFEDSRTTDPLAIIIEDGHIREATKAAAE